METGKTGKYFKYAIGEIILVVIGILIALGINNWNEQRKDRKKEGFFLNELSKEFKNDKTLLDRFIILTDNKVEKGRVVKSYLKGKNVSEDSLINHLFFNGKVLLFKSYTPVYDEIVSTGQTEIIQNDSIISLIKKYKEYLLILEDFLYQESNSIKENYNLHLYKYFDHEIITLLWEWNREAQGSPMTLIQNLKHDFEGFRADTQSYYNVSMTIGTDTELIRSYQTNVMTLLDRVVDALQKELDYDKVL